MPKMLILDMPNWCRKFESGRARLPFLHFHIISFLPLDIIIIIIIIIIITIIIIIIITSCGTRPWDGLPHLSYSLSTRFLEPLFSPVVPAVVPLCKCATHSLPFQCLRSLLPLGSVRKNGQFFSVLSARRAAWRDNHRLSGIYLSWTVDINGTSHT